MRWRAKKYCTNHKYVLGYTYQQLKGHKSGGEPSIISETATGRSGSTLKGVENLRICTRLTARAIAVGTGSRLDDVLLSNPGKFSANPVTALAAPTLDT